MNIEISVIVPVYNVEKFLPKCIESIINQTFRNIEIILVDDGSTDSSGSICDKYASQDSRINVIHKENEGVSVARNTGLKFAKGKYIAFVDGDDYLERSMYEELYNMLNNNNYDLVLSRFYRVSSDQSFKIEDEPLRSGEYNKDEIFNELILPMIGNDFNNMGKPLIMGSTCRGLYRVNILKQDKITFKVIKIAEDMLFNLDYLQVINKAYVIDKPLYYYRYNFLSATNKYIVSLWETLSEQLKLVEESLKKNNLLNLMSRERLESNKIYYISWCFTNECHYNNSRCYKEIINQMKRLAGTTEFRESFKWRNIIKAPFKERCVFICIKLRLYFLVYSYNKKRFIENC